MTVPIDYDREWAKWGDMSEHAPTPIHTRRLIIKEAKNLSFSNVLDVGCGTGTLLAAMRKRFPYGYFSGADISRIALEKAQGRCPGIASHVLDIQKEILEEKFDLILLSEVIEHLREPVAALRNIRRMCSGYLILTTPTGPRLATDLAFWHLKHFTFAELKTIVEESGFEVMRFYRWGWPFQILFRYLINLKPRWAHATFVRGGDYNLPKRIVSAAWASLFYLNMTGKGTQLIMLARVKNSEGSAA